MVLTIFGQIVVGPPGSGKSTYCKHIADNLTQLGRNAKIINLDPANDNLPYKAAVDVMQVLNVEQLMEQADLGPNGAMIACIEELRNNPAWLLDQIAEIVLECEKKNTNITEQHQAEQFKTNRPYLLFDCPGQSEIYTHNTAMRDIIESMTKKNAIFDLRLVCMNLCDAYYARDLGRYIGILMNSLQTMLNLQLPHVNILSKVDLLEKYGKTRFNLDYYCEVQSLKYLLETELEDEFFKRYKKLSETIAEVIEDYSLVSFLPLDITKPESVIQVLTLADRANGHDMDDLDLSILQQVPQLAELASGRRNDPISDGTSQMNVVQI